METLVERDREMDLNRVPYRNSARQKDLYSWIVNASNKLRQLNQQFCLIRIFVDSIEREENRVLRMLTKKDLRESKCTGV